MPPADLGALRKQLVAEAGETPVDNEDFCGYLMYPKVFTDYLKRHEDYGPVRVLPTPVFFYGMEPGQEIAAEIDPGKTIEIRLQAVGETNAEGEVRVFFELNGQPRTVRVPNRMVRAQAPRRPKAEAGNPDQVAAPMPGVIASVAVSEGQAVKAGDLLMTIEAMKMETGLYADHAGTVKALHVHPGAQVDAKDLLVELAEG
jgi:pyruvate carboxylase